MSPGRSGFIHTDEDTKKKAEHGTRVRDEFRHEFWLITLIHIYNNIETVQEVRFENP
jgi:hypothetical protein